MGTNFGAIDAALITVRSFTLESFNIAQNFPFILLCSEKPTVFKLYLHETSFFSHTIIQSDVRIGTRVHKLIDSPYLVKLVAPWNVAVLVRTEKTLCKHTLNVMQIFNSLPYDHETSPRYSLTNRIKNIKVTGNISEPSQARSFRQKGRVAFELLNFKYLPTLDSRRPELYSNIPEILLKNTTPIVAFSWVPIHDSRIVIP